MIGDHTNFEGLATTMNDIIRPMGFTYRDDLLFGFRYREVRRGDRQVPRPEALPNEQINENSLVPHPAMQFVPTMGFCVSCSIDPGWSRGRAAIVNTGLWSMGPDYHAENFFPIPEHCPEMRYGVFVQLWAAARSGPRAGLYRFHGFFELLRWPAGQDGADAGHDRVAQPPQPVARSPPLAAALGLAAGGDRLPGCSEAAEGVAGGGGGGRLRLGGGLVGGRCRAAPRHADPRMSPSPALRGHRPRALRGPAFRRRADPRRRQRLRAVGTMDRPVGLLYGAQDGDRGVLRRRAGSVLPQPPGEGRFPPTARCAMWPAAASCW